MKLFLASSKFVGSRSKVKVSDCREVNLSTCFSDDGTFSFSIIAKLQIYDEKLLFPQRIRCRVRVERYTITTGEALATRTLEVATLSLLDCSIKFHGSRKFNAKNSSRFL